MTNESKIKYSVIVPVHNAQKSLRKCLESILRSKLTEIEVICINDASTDISGKILENFTKKDPRIKVITLTENQGVAAARNSGLEVARGEIIGFVDSDDSIDESHFFDIYNKMKEESSEINIISFKFIKPDKVIYFPDLSKFISNFGNETQTMYDVDKLTFLDDYCWRLSVRRDFLNKYGFRFPKGIKGSEDQCFWKPLQLKATRVSFLENYGYNYFWNPESITKKEMSSFETVKGIDELMRRTPPEYHLKFMEKCFKRINDFKMKNVKLQNQLKREYVGRIYRKAREVGAEGYTLMDYDYKIGLLHVSVKDGLKELTFLGWKVPFIN